MTYDYRETRPFTNLIDREIETERRYGDEVLPIPKPRPPLDEPVLSSTPWNENGVTDVEQKPAMQRENRFEDGVGLKADSSPISTNFHDHLDDRSFLSLYKKLTPDERREQLIAQKEALIHEQNRLRQVMRQKVSEK